MAAKDPESIDPLVSLKDGLDELAREAKKTPKWNPTSVESMVDWLEQEVGLIVRQVPKVDRILRDLIGDLQARRVVRVLVIGPRGGGKTMLAAAIQLLSLRFYGASWTSIGGSLEQATRLFAHVRAAITRSADLQGFITEALATRIVAKNGATITVHAASEKSIRGQHPRGPSGAGGIVLDEAALIEDRIVDAAIPQVASADPSMILQLSTLGELQSGRFWELIQDHEARGYRIYEFGVFDVTTRCPFDCATTCPVPAFAKDEVREDSRGRVTSIRKALCAGKAHETNGWLNIMEVAQQYKDLSREAFQREFLGSSSTRVGAVYNAEDIDACIHPGGMFSRTGDLEQHHDRFRTLQKSCGVDWGFSSEAWAVYMVNLHDVLVVYRFEWWSHVRLSEISRHLVNRIFDERIDCVLPDAAMPSENMELLQMIRDREYAPQPGDVEDHSCRVLPVKFGVHKTVGIGEIRRRLENRLIRFPRKFGNEPVLNFDRAIRLLKAYHLDANGIPAKTADHFPDALLAGVLYWSPRSLVEPLELS
jgi:hypothetical protein